MSSHIKTKHTASFSCQTRRRLTILYESPIISNFSLKIEIKTGRYIIVASSSCGLDPVHHSSTANAITTLQNTILKPITYIGREVSSESSWSPPPCSAPNRHTSRHFLAPHRSSAAHPRPPQTSASPVNVNIFGGKCTKCK